MSNFCFCGKPLHHSGAHKGIKHSEEHKRKIGLGCKGKPAWNKGKHLVTRGSFKKGHIPWNKGLSFGGMSGKTQTNYQKNKVSNFMYDWWDKHPEQREKNRSWMYEVITDKTPNICISPEEERKFQSVRRRILKHDEYICQLCGGRGNTVHHIDYNRTNNVLLNLITLCGRCNTKVNKNRDFWKNYFSDMRKNYLLGRRFTEENMDMNSLVVRIKCGY